MAAVRNKMDASSSSEAAFDRVPPQALDAESAVLGSILLDNECIAKVIEILDDSCFYKGQHREIYGAMLSLYERNAPVDLVTLSEELKRRKTLDQIGGTYFLTELSESVPTSANVEHHAGIIFEKALLRKLIEAAGAIAKDSFDENETALAVLDRSEQRIFGLSDKRLRKSFLHIRPVIEDTLHEIDEFHKRKGTVTGVSTGFAQLDELTSGFQQGELIIVAGRPSMGKTAFCLNIARHVAVEEKQAVGIFSLEMSMRQLAMRLLCAEARVDAHGLRTGRLPDRDWSKISMCVGTLTEAPIYIDDSAGLSVLELRAKARRLKREKNIGLIVIDYLQLMQGPRSIESRQQEISIISRSLKALAKELDIPVVALSQLSRAVEMRGGERKPMLSDLRESGAIEQDADVVLFIYRPEFYGKMLDEQGIQTEGRAEVIIGKQRNGPVGTIPLTFIKKYARFENPAFEEANVPV
jgi:replicative DNA helicase